MQRTTRSSTRSIFRSLVTLGVLLLAAGPSAGAQGRPSGAAAAFKPHPLSLFDRQKAESLLRTRYPCLGCHEIAGTGGRVGPSLSGVGARRSVQYVYSMISDPLGTVPGTVMPRVEMPARTLKLIVSYLVQGEGVSSPPAAVKTTPPAASAGPGDESPDGAALYARHCATCHGPAGRGDGPNSKHLPVPPTTHASTEAMSQRSDDALFDTIFSGGYIMNRSNLMPPFGATLTRAQIHALVRHIRTLCRCEGPAWSRDPQPR